MGCQQDIFSPKTPPKLSPDLIKKKKQKKKNMQLLYFPLILPK